MKNINLPIQYVIYSKNSLIRFSLKEFLEFLSKEEVSFGSCTHNYNYKRLEFEVEELFDALLREGHLGTITLEDREIEPDYVISKEYLDDEPYNMHLTTLIILLKVLQKKGFFNYYNLNKLKYIIHEDQEFADFQKVDNYLNGEDVKFNNENYKKVVDVLLKKVEDNKDKLYDIQVGRCTINIIIWEFLEPEQVDDPDNLD